MPEPMLLWHWLACCGFQFPCSGLQMVFRQLSSDSNWMLASSPKHCFCVAISPEGKREAHTAYKAQKACIPSFTRLFYQFVPAVRAAVGRRFSTQLSCLETVKGGSSKDAASESQHHAGESLLMISVALETPMPLSISPRLHSSTQPQ